MDSAYLDFLPIEFKPYREQLEATLQPCHQIIAQPGATQLCQSKFLGLPYNPMDCPYPQDIDDKPMILLAQLNFSDIPPLTDFPEQGLLQIFISAHDEFYGADLQNFASMQQQKRFYVRYFDTLDAQDNCIQDFEFLRTFLSGQDLILPVQKECQLRFESDMSFMSPSDYRFDRTLGPKFFAQFGVEHEDLQDYYWQMFSGQGHRMGGYAFFTQPDPRAVAPEEDDWVLLLQIDSDDVADVMWGDLGVGHFFVPRRNLQTRDFSRILYTWDCG